MNRHERDQAKKTGEYIAILTATLLLNHMTHKVYVKKKKKSTLCLPQYKI